MKNHGIWNLNFLNHILDAMAEGLFTLDQDGTITAWNRAMEKISGYTAEQALGQQCGLIKCSRCYDQTQPMDISQCKVLTQGQAEAKECFIRHKDGYDVPVIKNARLVRDEKNNVLGIVETLTDLTEIKAIKAREASAKQELKKRYALGNIIGKSAAMEKVFHAIRAAADSRATILIQGESGTGKELVARAIHYEAAGGQRPLVTVNCSALSETLLESELFGHVKGAFTGAHKDRIGRFEQADTGTIFLDEIGELTPYMQVKLLRVLQEREIERVGDTRKKKIDIRIIAATHKDLSTLTREGMFREDLYYRLKVFPIRLPPLRQRLEDIPLLVRSFIEKGNKHEDMDICNVTPDAMKALMAYPWPGNVRELENAIAHGFVLCRTREITCADLPDEVCSNNQSHTASPPGNDSFSHQPSFSPAPLTRERLVSLLYACNWNKAEVARQLGKSRTLVWKYMKKWDIPLKKD
ncbi:sigma 54-interacting transcriptional regulator [uncultured Desulfobacter sp.]|uniref:sigma-54 interaction domain-containing protein n=1 Tax=uncultured Desulfobacter sp. TaxID=240139 RepID=UPI0029F48C0E|nr:sigma 54-interacting transcriptional regulator [uncultured Desulfobacter sp.]